MFAPKRKGGPAADEEVPWKRSISASKHQKFEEDDEDEDDDDDDDDEDEDDEDEDDDNDDDEEDEDDENGDGYYDDDDDDVDDAVKHAPTLPRKTKTKREEDVPLWQRVQQLNQAELEASSSVTQHTTERVKRKRDDASTAAAFGARRPTSVEGRANKNAPAVMKSNRPVRRLRIDANNASRKFRDPRFTEGSGTLDSDKFHHNYAFLDEYQEDEVNALGRALKKTKNADQREQLKAELLKRKQELTERRRSLKVKARLLAVKQDEREKVKNGKTPFFLKRSAKKQIALEERFDELKKEGKLSSFLQKKRKRNANKEHKSLPRQRVER